MAAVCYDAERFGDDDVKVWRYRSSQYKKIALDGVSTERREKNIF